MSEWDHGWETRPLERGPVLSTPACSLTLSSAEVVRLPYQRITLGSAPDNDVTLSDETVSRYHAEILRVGEGYLLRDLDSTNGTTVDRVRVREAYLGAAAELILGEVQVRFDAVVDVVDGEPSPAHQLGEMVGCSEGMRRLFSVVQQVAPTDVAVLLQGETGTGKEVVARTLHDLSRRGESPFVVVDCSAIPANLMESELFGHERGSFSGAVTSRQGLFELAHEGTLFLDEVGELPLELQPKLLRALETSAIRRVGGQRQINLDFRLVTATHRDLARMVAQGEFRADLYYRLNVIPILLPPLRDRREDMEPLLRHFLSGMVVQPGVGEAAVARVLAAAGDLELPGNVRELRNLLVRAVAAPESILAMNQAPCDSGTESPATTREIPDFKRAKEALVEDFERDYLTGLLAQTRGNLSAAARVAGLDRKYFRQLLRRHGMYGDG
jgi:transcriptional regulator with GAF, ATPase, and Fis domain